MGSTTPWAAGGLMSADKHPEIPQVGITPFWVRFEEIEIVGIPLNTGLQPVLPGIEDALCPGEMFV